MDRTAIERRRAERQHAIERIKVRAEMRSAHEIEDSEVIEREALSRHPHSSTPAPAKGVVAVLSAKPSWQMVAIVAIVATAAATGALRPVVSIVTGWFKP